VVEVRDGGGRRLQPGRWQRRGQRQGQVVEQTATRAGRLRLAARRGGAAQERRGDPDRAGARRAAAAGSRIVWLMAESP
jgi:hypothetical protein